jgi:hypothetical protein
MPEAGYFVFAMERRLIRGPHATCRVGWSTAAGK